MKGILTLFLLVQSLSWLFAADVTIPKMLVSDYDRGAAIVENGKVIWQYGHGVCQDSWILPDGNFLIPSGNKVEIVTKEKKVVWSYRGKDPVYHGRKGRLEIHTCQPLAGGRVLIGEGAYGHLIEVDHSGKVVKTVQLESVPNYNHGAMRIARKVKSGHYVVAVTKNRICEFNQEGKIIRTVDPTTVTDPRIVWKHVHGVSVLENGNWLIGTGHGATFFEVTPQNRVVWFFDGSDAPELGITYAANCERLADGTTVVTAYNSKYQVLAIDQAGKVIWKWQAPANLRKITNVKFFTD
jgi:hypothetical protein